mmetsp:Transcript_3978/g.6757  ORF Transcript_3978/g.6757 Transcript_3978/m.6757 type:complete len:97 (-) Transcript_3978:62-352(-)
MPHKATIRLLLWQGPRFAGAFFAGSVGMRGRMAWADTQQQQFSSAQANDESHNAQQSVDVHDIGIIGGGIVGLAVAREFKLRYPEKSMVLLEKEVT